MHNIQVKKGRYWIELDQVSDVLFSLKCPKKDGFVIYGAHKCQYFEKSKEFLSNRSISFQYIAAKSLSQYKTRLLKLQQRLKHTFGENPQVQMHDTSPIIFFANAKKKCIDFIGGYTELKQLKQKNSMFVHGETVEASEVIVLDLSITAAVPASVGRMRI